MLDDDLPSKRGETWNDTEAIDRHRMMTPSQRVALAIEVSRAALRFATAPRALVDERERASIDEASQVPDERCR